MRERLNRVEALQDLGAAVHALFCRVELAEQQLEVRQLHLGRHKGLLRCRRVDERDERLQEGARL